MSASRFTRVGLPVATTVVVVLAFALAVAAAGSASTRAVHFAGFPPKGVEASTPTTGRLLIGLATGTTTWNVYADRRVVWQKLTSSGDATAVPDGAKRLDTGYVQQRLTPLGVRLLLSRILATGLFENDLTLDLWRGHASVFHQVRRGDRLVRVIGVPSPDPADSRDFTKATPAQTHALAWIEKLMADQARWLPTKAWADREISAFVPARYVVAFDRSYPDISKLPPPAGTALAPYKQLESHGCQVLTTGQARALLQAFVEAGLSPSENHAFVIAFALPARRGLSDFHVSPALPDTDRC